MAQIPEHRRSVVRQQTIDRLDYTTFHFSIKPFGRAVGDVLGATLLQSPLTRRLKPLQQKRKAALRRLSQPAQAGLAYLLLRLESPVDLATALFSEHQRLYKIVLYRIIRL